MLKKLLIVTTVLLLQHLTGWSQCNPSTGEQSLSDTTTYPIEIGIIRQANIKLVKYEALKQIVNQQESIIKLHESKDLEYENIICTFQERIDLTNKINNDLQESLEKQKRNNYIYIGVGAGIAATLLISLICK